MSQLSAPCSCCLQEIREKAVDDKKRQEYLELLAQEIEFSAEFRCGEVRRAAKAAVGVEAFINVVCPWKSQADEVFDICAPRLCCVSVEEVSLAELFLKTSPQALDSKRGEG